MISSNQCNEAMGKKRTNTLADIRRVRKTKLVIVIAFKTFKITLSILLNEPIIFSMIPASPTSP